VLANLLALDKFDYDAPEQIRVEIFPPEFDIAIHLNNVLKDFNLKINGTDQQDLQRIGEVPIYRADPIVRRAESLQQTNDALPPKAWMSLGLMSKLNVDVGSTVKVQQGEVVIQLQADCDDKLPNNCVRIACAHPDTQLLGDLFGAINVEKVEW
jgi:NADH-quinone oxidoreductase subunit G